VQADGSASVPLSGSNVFGELDAVAVGVEDVQEADRAGDLGTTPTLTPASRRPLRLGLDVRDLEGRDDLFLASSPPPSNSPSASATSRPFRYMRAQRSSSSL
jgi:hypothetical protein